MAELQDKISKRFPDATFENGEILLINIADAQLHDLVKSLRDEHGFDYLVTIVGMDWTTSMGCIYYLTSTATRQLVSVKVQTADRDKPMLHSIADLYRIAGIFEREVYDFYGIVFIGNPDMRRLFLNIGYPLRKDYDATPELNPVSIENERQSDSTYTWVEQADGTVEKKEVAVFTEEDFVVNIGPQHPATHGVLRFRTSVDGETIKKIDVYMGYIHRGVEKLCEDLSYMQTLHFMDRLDYFSAHNYHHGLCLCIEKAAGIEVPERARVIRVLMDELSRIASHCLFIGTFCMDLGATTMLFYTLRVREQVLDIMEKTCGARMTFNYDCLGGVMADLDPDFVGVLSREDAISYGVSGPSGRASGWACDVRKTHPYSGYEKIEFEQVVRTEGDSMARFKNRVDEILQSAHIIEQLIDNIPEGEWLAKVPKVLKLPVGHWFQLVEGCRGVFGVYIESDGGTKPYRLKLVTPSLTAAAVVDHITSGQKIADLITIGGSLDYIVHDMDR